MDQPTTFSVVIPTHDTRELVLRCVESVLAAARPEVELIVVDDGSSDGTGDALRAEFPIVELLRREHAVGFTAAANAGLASASGELLLLLNSDTELPPGSLHRLAAAFAAEPRLGIAGAELRYPDGSSQWSGGRWPTPLWLFALASGLPGLLGRVPGWRRLKPPGTPAAAGPDWVSGAAMAIRRACWIEVGPLDQRYEFYGQDLALCHAASTAGWRVALVPGFSVTHHHGATIGNRPGAVDDANPALLWSDLLRFVASARGRGAAARARRALLLGAGLRLALRTGPALLLAGDAGRRWRQRSAAYRAGFAAVRKQDLARTIHR